MNNIGKMNIDEIERLVVASQAGERCAFDELVQIFQRQAMQAAVRITGNANEAAEAVQEAFAAAYIKIDKLKNPRKFAAWFLRIATNEAVNRRRQIKHRAEILKSNLDCEYETILQSKGTDEELREEIGQAMSKLSEKEAKAISLFGLDGLSHAQVAEIMDCSAAAAKWYVFRARQKLKILLKEYL